MVILALRPFGCAQGKLFRFAPVFDWRFYLRVLKKDVEIKRFYLTGKWLIWYKK
jgi:hypothetical protein